MHLLMKYSDSTLAVRAKNEALCQSVEFWHSAIAFFMNVN